MAIIFGTLISLIPLTILFLIGFAVFSALKKKEQGGIESKPQAVDITYYILMFVSLVASLGAIIGILFAAINHRFKDVLELGNYYNELSVGDDVRISVAVLFVLFPLYIVLSLLQVKRIKLDIERVKLNIRMVYTYAIVLVTSLTIVGNFIYIIYNLLSGEVLVRFVPKSLILLVLALFVLGYHIYLLKRDYTKKSQVGLVFMIASILLAVGSVAYGIAETGTPAEVRARKMDDKRLQDLSLIQQQILQKWQKDGVLPNELGELNDEISGNIIPLDPKTKAVYEYKVVQNSTLSKTNKSVLDIGPEQYESALGKLLVRSSNSLIKADTDAIFELCATFETERAIGKKIGQDQYGYKGGVGMSEMSYRLDAGYYTGDNQNPTWDHKAERTCFTRTIKKDQYQIYNN
ncbi:MAG: hypothetical protein RI996_80 [Candidatus Parcubacteria bacterium]|jgi:hypothetical protein